MEGQRAESAPKIATKYQNLLDSSINSAQKLTQTKKIVAIYFLFCYNTFRHP